jgi:hypothetical protein
MEISTLHSHVTFSLAFVADRAIHTILLMMPLPLLLTSKTLDLPVIVLPLIDYHLFLPPQIKSVHELYLIGIRMYLLILLQIHHVPLVKWQFPLSTVAL